MNCPTIRMPTKDTQMSPTLSIDETGAHFIDLTAISLQDEVTFKLIKYRGNQLRQAQIKSYADRGFQAIQFLKLVLCRGYCCVWPYTTFFRPQQLLQEIMGPNSYIEGDVQPTAFICEFRKLVHSGTLTRKEPYRYTGLLYGCNGL